MRWLLLLSACQPAVPGLKDLPIGHDLDSGGNDCVSAVEVPYDGIDQDCSGADLTDVDGDGQDATAVGGHDCDDADPATYAGATEIPYDGVDQDCDGTDVVDADGDGHEAAVVGGDDCDDGHASAYPGGAEIRADGVDNDCDGRVDEYVTCWDGSGDFITVQEGVDGTPDGGTLEICAGVYDEVVDITDRTLSVEGADPATVVLETAGRDPVVRVGGTSDVRMSSMTLSADTACLAYQTAAIPVTVAMVHFNQCVYAVSSGSGAAGINIEKSYFTTDYYQTVQTIGPTRISQSIFEAMSGADIVVGLSSSEEIFSNNILTGAMIGIGGETTVDSDEVNAALINNTFASIGRLILETLTYDGVTPPQISLTNNIFADFRSEGEGYPLFWALVESPDRSAAVAPACSNNLYSDDGLSLSEVDTLQEVDTDYYAWVPDPSLTARVEASLISSGWRGDPGFAPGAMGNFSLPASSPGVDAGAGPPDTDGSQADLGAFGGPAGDWWMEVPWPLP